MPDCEHERKDFFRRYIGVDTHPIKAQHVPFDDPEMDFEGEDDLELGEIDSDEYEEVVHTWIRCSDCRALLWEA